MPPLLELIAQQEAAATAAADTLRAQVTTLSESLALTETELTELAIASVAHQKILTAFTTTPNGMRAKDVCLAFGHGITAKDRREHPSQTQTPRRRPHPHRNTARPIHAHAEHRCIAI